MGDRRDCTDQPCSEFRMNVVECDVPSGSMLSRELIERADFRDSYRAPLSHRELGIVDVFFGIFAHHPVWMKLLLIVRNKVAREGLSEALTGGAHRPAIEPRKFPILGADTV
jgi:hypothetical protein